MTPFEKGHAIGYNAGPFVLATILVFIVSRFTSRVEFSVKSVLLTAGWLWFLGFVGRMLRG